MRMVVNMFVLVFSVGFAGTSIANDFYVYPANGQSPEQTEKDKFECYNWAKGQSLFDPMAVPTATSAPPAQEPQQGGAGRGLLGGAAAGAVIGGIAGDVGKGAAIGAVSGTLFGGARRSNQQKRQQSERQQWEQQQASQYANARNQYNRAYVACLEARGYSVK